MMNTRLTILIPTYNRGDLIQSTIDNCFEQSYKDFTILVYDDASNDNTRIIMKSLIKKYPGKIEYLRGDRNKGIGNARNVLISQLKTEFGMWLDSDDLMTPDRIEKCISYMDKNPNIDIVYSNIQWFTEDSNKITLRDHITIDVTKYDKERWRSLTFNTACATGFFRKKLSSFKFEDSLRLGGEDVLWIWKLLQYDIKVGHIKESLYLYRNHNERIGKKKRETIMQSLKEREEVILSRKINEIKNGKS